MHALALLLVQSPAAPAVDLDRLLAERADPASRARVAEPRYRLRAISASRSSHDERAELTIADLEGPGALVRIESRGAAGTIRIRLDGAKEPVFARATQDGGVLDVPIPFAERCRVTADGTSSGTWMLECRAYAAGTKVVSATRASLESTKEVSRPAVPGTDTFTFSLSEEIPEGGLTSLDPKDSSGPRAITRIHLRAEASDLPLALRTATLRLVFDGATTVECPLGDFFGCPNGPEPHESPDFTVAAGIDEATGRPGTQVELVCRFVMPYRERFDLSIDARRAGDLHVAGIVRTMPWTWDERSMHFHAGPRVEGAGVLAGEWNSGARRGSVSRRHRALDAMPFESAADLESILGPRSMAYSYALTSPPGRK